MKKLLFILTLTAAGLIAAPSLTLAEDTKPAPPAGGGPRHGDHMDPAARLKMMTEKLGLTQDQQDKIKAIFEKDAPAIKEIMAKGRENLTEADKTKLTELFKSQHEEINAVLTPEQQAKMKEMHGPGQHGPGQHGPGQHGPGGPGHKPGAAKGGEAK